VSNLAERIRTARREAGLTHVEVAERLDVTPSAVSQWETGISRHELRPDIFGPSPSTPTTEGAAA
jgi:transcriptional regulator with XRE-family HTH domain